jgi:PhnB protein
MKRLVDIQWTTLKPGRRDDFHRLLTEQSLPLQRRWGVDVVDHDPSAHDPDSYYVIRAYASADWRQGPREAILALIESYTNIVREMEPEQVEALRTVPPPTASPEEPPMPKPYKPEGYTSVAVYLMASQAQPVIDFLVAAFGATPTRRYEAPDGSIMHAEVQIDDTVVMITDGGEAAFPAWLHVYVPDVDATYQRALAAGGTSVQAPTQKPNDPDRRGGVKDPAGNTWWIATQVG